VAYSRVSLELRLNQQKMFSNISWSSECIWVHRQPLTTDISRMEIYVTLYLNTCNTELARPVWNMHLNPQTVGSITAFRIQKKKSGRLSAWLTTKMIGSWEEKRPRNIGELIIFFTTRFCTTLKTQAFVDITWCWKQIVNIPVYKTKWTD